MLWLWKNQALIPFVDNYLLFNFMYASDSSTASISNIGRAVIHFCTGSPLVFTIPILAYFCFSKKEIADWLCFVSLGLSLLSMSISGRTYAHYGMILCPLVVYAVSRAFVELDTKLFSLSQISKRQKLSVALSIFCAIILLFLQPIKTMAGNILYIPLKSNSSTEWHEIAEIVTENTNKSDLITVCGNRNIIYLLSDRKSASKYSYQYPIAEINPNIKTEYLDDIRQLKAKIIIVEKDYFLYDDIMDVDEQNYMLLETINSTHIYLRNS